PSVAGRRRRGGRRPSRSRRKRRGLFIFGGKVRSNFHSRCGPEITAQGGLSKLSEMSDKFESSLINLGELSKPATVLIEKISDAVGGIFKPYQIIRVAKAEAQADRVRAENQIEISDLHRRAFHRFLNEEAIKQNNIEQITE